MLETPNRRAGATDLRALQPGSAEHRQWLDISAQAFPVVRLQTAAQRDAAFAEQRELATRAPEQQLVGAFRDGVLVGGMRVYDFTMCVRGAQVFTGGVGSVAVGLEYKQRGVARDLIAGFLAEYRARGAALAALYPFRPDFYRKLGFGFGTKMDQYRIALSALPRTGAREHVRRLGPRDVEAFGATYARVQRATNGLIVREAWRSGERLAAETMHTFGFDDGGLRGYLTYELRLGKAGTWNRNELYVHEFIYETPAALMGLLAFVRSQSDQYAALVMNTQDAAFHFILNDPRNGSDRTLYPPVYHETNAQGVGIMYRVVNAAELVRALAACRFGDLDATLRVVLADAFFAPNAAACVIAFHRGRPEVVDAACRPDVELTIDVADFSALVMGSVRLRPLVGYGRAILSNTEWLTPLDVAFDTVAPQCLTRF